MQAEQITIVDNRAAYRRKLRQRLAVNPTDISLIKQVIKAKLMGVSK